MTDSARQAAALQKPLSKAPPFLPGDRALIQAASFEGQQDAIGRAGTVFAISLNGLVYVDLKEHRIPMNGWEPKHLKKL